MVYAKLAYLAFIASLYQVSDAQSLRRVRPGCMAPRVPAPTPYRSSDMISDRYRYECNLEDIISKLINALVYTILRKDGSGGGGAGGGSGGVAGGNNGGGAGGGNGSGGGAGSGGSGSSSLLKSLLELDVSMFGNDLADIDILPGFSGGDGSTNAQRKNTHSGDGDPSLLGIDAKINGRNLARADLIGG